MGAIQEKDGRKIILASDFVKGTFEEDYGNLATVKELFPTIFSYSETCEATPHQGVWTL